MMTRTVTLAVGICGAVALAATALAGSNNRGAHNSIAWKQCMPGARLQCGSIEVPVDWAKPAGARIRVSFARRPADNPAKRIGTLFFQPGGPSDGGIAYLDPAAAKFMFSSTLLKRFDIVGADPRGFGQSTPVRCGVPLVAPGITLFPSTPEQFERLVKNNRAAGRSCLRKTGALLGHVDAESIARDHEAIRAAMGVDKVSFLSFSYDAQPAAIYAQLYPKHVRAMAIDAVLEHDLSNTLAVAAEISTAETSFNRFASWCKTAASCALKGRDVGRFYDRLVQHADRHPIPVKGAVRPVSGEDIRLNTQLGLLFKHPTKIHGPEYSWSGLSRSLVAAAAGHAEAFATSRVASKDGYEQAVICNDYPSPIHTYAEMRRRLEMGRQLAPHLQGASQAWSTTRCIGWPVKAANPRRTLNVRGAPPILIVNATHDPSTSYVWAHGLAEQIQGSVVLTRVGDGHTSYYTYACAREAIDHYLVTTTTPAPDAVCPH